MTARVSSALWSNTVTPPTGTPSNAGESEGTPESSPVERTSHATFIAPALPPIRISMGGSDFSEFSGYFKALDDANGTSKNGAAAQEGGKLKLDLTLTPPDSAGAPTEVYPLNPNGSPGGITGVQTPDGRVLALMPHPERVVTLESNSWYPPEFAEAWKGTGPWFRLFQSARKWCGE